MAEAALGDVGRLALKLDGQGGNRLPVVGRRGRRKADKERTKNEEGR
jgi:hypothetical protein